MCIIEAYSEKSNLYNEKKIVQSENKHYIFHSEQDIPFFK